MKKRNYTDMLAYLGISSAHPGGSKLTKDVLTRERLNSDMSVLDIGCGIGHTAALLAKKYKCNVTALDAHPTMIQKTKKRFERENISGTVLIGSAEDLPFESETFDYIFAESVIAFTDTKFSLPEFFRVLKQGGRLIAIEMVALKSLTATENTEILNVYGIKEVLSQEKWKANFHNAGFRVVLTEEDRVTSDNRTEIEKHDPSHFIDPALFKILESHIELLQKYKNKLGYRIFRCEK